MTTYHFKNSPVIDRVEMRTLRKDISQATIVAKDSVDAAELEKIRTVLGRHKLSTMMDSAGGHAAIQVRGLKDATKLFSYFAEAGISTQGMRKEITAADHHKKETMKDRVRGKAMFLSALFYDLGNISFIVSGIQRGRHNPKGFQGADFAEIGIGGLFGFGDALMTFYGRDHGDEELSAAALSLKKYLHSKGITVPKGNTLNPDSLYQSGAFKATDRWMHKHIGHVKCLTEAAAGLSMIVASFRTDELAVRHINQGKLMAGFLLVTGWLATFLLDKPRGHEVFDKEEPGERMIDHVTDNPRGWIARPASLGNNIANLYGALNPKTGEKAKFKKYIRNLETNLQGAYTSHNPTSRADVEKRLTYAQLGQHDYIWNVFSSCSFLVANFLFGLSGGKRPHDTEDDKSMMNDLVILGANVIAGLPGAVTSKVLDDTAEYVSKLNHVTLNKEQVAEAIRNKVAELNKTNWKTTIVNTAPADRVHRGTSEQFAHRFPAKSGSASRAEQLKSGKKPEQGPSIA